MADIVDIANDHTEWLLQASLQRRQVQTGPSAEECDSCGTEIPEARRRLVPGCTLCVDCQAFREKRNA
ncbi:TraR/DksA family transcriptional regulator [Pseudomonas oryzihabitans]|uniref:TraR/DksA family transcriptional regulator n=1 Tax=Pseudomonas oryzihabitans TaxID=47885 RepID=UPI00289523C0|nr:TraR/DksA family transcriptional regulator [Pseudomonas oryzihabitans]MDT3720332.1 TraR/DksA family transcriptional regulator [Pseudomonas oryzihabitans]